MDASQLKLKISALQVALKEAPAAQKKELGLQINKLKSELELLQDTSSSADQELRVDASLPGLKTPYARLHPTTIVINQITEFFNYLGYSVYEGPEIETDEYNFNKLNLPADHPARELQDTLYISDPELMLRTHTSSVETRCMTSHKPPIRIIVPGLCYRNENTNMTNNSIFYQLEGLFVDRGVNMSHLKSTLESFAKFLYGDTVVTRFRCKYYPQVEPGCGMDVRCLFCEGKGCQTCKFRGYIEILGAGMVHPKVLESCGIDSRKYSGFAFGMGLDRLVMMKYGIKDIRQLYNGELVWKD